MALRWRLLLTAVSGVAISPIVVWGVEVWTVALSVAAVVLLGVAVAYLMGRADNKDSE